MFEEEGDPGLGCDLALFGGWGELLEKIFRVLCYSTISRLVWINFYIRARTLHNRQSRIWDTHESGWDTSISLCLIWIVLY